MKERQKYQDMKKVQGKKGSDREAITLASDLGQFGSFLRILRFPPPIKLTATI
jgi:hypothetical protein